MIEINIADLSLIFRNKIIIIAFITWILNQSLKLMVFYITEKKWDIRRFVGAGGMPSTHSALSVCVAVTIGLKEGWESPLFALAIVIAFIIMADAAGVRRETGEQAKVLNKIILEFFEERKIRDKNLKELVGHTPFEVIVGAFIGIVMAWILCAVI
ncbi:MAG: divergent PAP2 family protein [Atribacteria sp.]|nr:divergent PAP2 family protein [Candidatus Atribacteria bacterium]MBU1036064.1 divergent PAP2 family protein [bacterium]MBU1290858.1 divergent PAP2 family protein [bacterium]MBU1427740.1 divergent PAP2 family protein [bacterium]MBU2440619.1 divergent PAP2 family protein [bacterium]